MFVVTKTMLDIGLFHFHGKKYLFVKTYQQDIAISIK